MTRTRRISGLRHQGASQLRFVLWGIAALCLLPMPSRAQERTWISSDYDFAGYLIDNDMKADAKALLQRDAYFPSDTLTFLRAWTAYQLKELEEAERLFREVPQTSALYEKALFYSVAVDAHLGDYDSPARRLESYHGPYAELKGEQLAGLALLRDDPQAFKAAATSFRYSDFALRDAELQLDAIYNDRYVKPGKSPWLAAAASTLVPGLGKVYAGRLGEGIAAFLITGALGAITAEHWIKDGPGDWKTIVPGVLGAGFYLGNIYGSYMSVSIYNSNIRDAQQTAVLYNVHIPLRSVFR